MEVGVSMQTWLKRADSIKTLGRLCDVEAFVFSEYLQTEAVRLLFFAFGFSVSLLMFYGVYVKFSWLNLAFGTMFAPFGWALWRALKGLYAYETHVLYERGIVVFQVRLDGKILRERILAFDASWELDVRTIKERFIAGKYRVIDTTFLSFKHNGKTLLELSFNEAAGLNDPRKAFCLKVVETFRRYQIIRGDGK